MSELFSQLIAGFADLGSGWLTVLLSPLLMGLLNSKTTSLAQDNKAAATDDSQAATSGGIVGANVAASGRSQSSSDFGQSVSANRSTILRDDAIQNLGEIVTGVKAGRDVDINSGLQLNGITGNVSFGGGEETASLAQSLTSRFADTVKALTASTSSATQSLAQSLSSGQNNSSGAVTGAISSLNNQLQSALSGIKELATVRSTDGLSIGAKVVLAVIALLALGLFTRRK